MAQHDQVIDNGPGLAVRTDINAALAALFSSSSGTVEPVVKVAGQLWFNTSTGRLQVRNAANTAWEAVSKYMGGTVTLDSLTTMQGTSSGVGTELAGVRDDRTTVGAEGNAVFAIKRQNSGTAGLMFGNDGNSAGLIGANNASLRLGKWVSGVFTEYMNVTTAGVVNITGKLQVGDTIIDAAVAGMEIAHTSPRIKFTDTTADAHNFWAYVDNNTFFILVDRDNSGSWESPNPLELRSATNLGFLFGNEILTVNKTIPNSMISGAYSGITTLDTTGRLTVTNAGEVIRINGPNATDDPYITFYAGGARQAYIQHTDGTALGNGFRFFNDVTDDYLYLSNVNNIDALKFWDNSVATHQVVYHTGNLDWTWASQSRAFNTTYQNTLNKPIFASVSAFGDSGFDFQVSSNNSTWITIGTASYDATSGSARDKFAAKGPFLVPAGWYYRLYGTGSAPTINWWTEAR